MSLMKSNNGKQFIKDDINRSRKRAVESMVEQLESFDYFDSIKNCKEIMRKLLIYILTIDEEKETFEELANAIGISYEEFMYLRIFIGI